MVNIRWQLQYFNYSTFLGQFLKVCKYESYKGRRTIIIFFHITWKKLKCRLVILSPPPPHFSTLKCFHCLTYYLEVFSSNHQTVSLHQLYILVDQNHMLCWTPLTSCIWNVSKNRIMLCQITQSLCTGLKPLIHSPIAFNVLAISSIHKCFFLY